MTKLTSISQVQVILSVTIWKAEPNLDKIKKLYLHFQALSDTFQRPTKLLQDYLCHLLGSDSAHTLSLQQHKSNSQCCHVFFFFFLVISQTVLIDAKRKWFTFSLPLSTMWSRPPSSRSSSLNQSPALLEVSDNNVSMARWPVYKKI